MNTLIYKIGIATGVVEAVLTLIYVLSGYFLYKPVLLNLADYLPFSIMSGISAFVVLVWFLKCKKYILLIPFLSVVFVINIIAVVYLWLGLNNYVQYDLSIGNTIDYASNASVILYALFIVFSKSREHELFRLYGMLLLLLALAYLIIVLGGWENLQPISGLEFILPLLLSYIYYKEIQKKEDIEANIIDD